MRNWDTMLESHGRLDKTVYGESSAKVWKYEIWKALKSTKDEKKVIVLCIVEQNHERSVVVLDHFSYFKGI